MDDRTRRSTALVWPILLAPWLIAAPPLIAPAQANPDFSNVDDVLQGRRVILPIQDVVTSFPGSEQNTILRTEQGSISGQTPYAVGHEVLSTASGRVFDLENDVIVTLVRTGSQSVALDIRDPVGDRTLPVNLSTTICQPSLVCIPSIVVLGDLTGDGYDEIVMSYAGGGIQVATAANVASFADGLVFGEEFDGSATVPVPTPQALAVGDLDGDGRGEIAAVDLPQFEIYTLVTPPDSNEPSLNIERASFASFEPAAQGSGEYALQIGQFDAEDKERELVIGWTGPETDLVNLVLVKVAADLTPTLGPQQPQTAGQRFAIAAGRLDWFGDTDQLVLATDQIGAGVDLFVLVLDSSGQFILPFSGIIIEREASGCPQGSLSGLAIGDFDFDLQNPETTPPDLEVAALLSCTSQLMLLKVDPSNKFVFSIESTASVAQTGIPPAATALVASDTQGRSLRLGPPDKVTINQHSQPRIIMGAPPMHIDFVQDPANSSADFGKVNMTAFPATDESSARGMNSEFDLASTSQIQTQTQDATSYNYSVTKSDDVSLGIDVPDVASLGAGTKSTATTTHANLVEDTFGAYSNSAFDISTITGFGDVVWYDSNRFNLWIYRVLGHLACPADDPDCNARLPLYLTFSGPDKLLNHPHTPGPVVEWYQPYHEVGNILSYPQDLTQLGEALSSEFVQFFELEFTTGNNDDTETLRWTQGGGEAQTSGSVTTHSRSKTESVSASASLSALIDFGLGTSVSSSFSENNSTSVSTLNTTVQTMAASSGFQVSVPGFNFGGTYSYSFDGFILGDSGDLDVLQTELLDNLKGQVDQTIAGTLRLAFTAQPDAAAGSWWSNQTAPYLSAPDVALNHPFRWSLLSETSGPLSSVYCFNVLDRDDVQKGGGYEIKGLFVLPEGATSGPQLTVANEGDTLQLQARVYNYSRLDMTDASPAVAHVKVQFYGQEWDAATQEFAGDAFLIDEVTLDPIAGNNSNNQNLNSALASATFATGSCPLEGGCGGKYLKFWLVVWMEDAEGDLVADYRDHGLKKAPTGSFTSMGQVDIEPISNNVGFYDQELYVCPEGAQCPTPPDSAAAAGLTIEEVTVSTGQASTNETLEVSARLRAGEQPVGPALVFFHDGDPAGGAAFEVEHVPFIAANASYLAKVRYQPKTRGAHDIVVVAHAGGRAVTGTTRLDVTEPAAAAPTCQNPLTVASRLGGSIHRIGEPDANARLRLSAVVPFDGPVDLGAATVTIDHLAHEPGGAQELVADGNGESFLPLALEARHASRRTLFETGRGVSPKVRLALHRLPGDRLQVRLRVRGATVPEAPDLCEGDPVTTSLMARLAIDDGTNPPVQVPIEGTWECLTDGHGDIRGLRARDT
jgi:hypothetical protein